MRPGPQARRINTQNNSYVFGHSQPEIERLRRQAEMLRPITQRLLISAGVKKGMRVLDIGCGPGDVTMLAADLVGSTGRVVGIDRDESVIDAARQRSSELGFSNVEFVRRDVETYDGPAGFDVAVCRYVLIHQTDPVRFLQVTRGLVRSGGVIALHEMNISRGGTVTLIEKCSSAVGFGAVAMKQRWVVHISDGSVERGDLTPDREAVNHLGSPVRPEGLVVDHVGG
jgi:ubiquinone/menaquinone biosynthesis C-methylase UbiE